MKEEKKTRGWLTGIGMCVVILFSVVYTWVRRQRRKVMEALLCEDAELVQPWCGQRGGRREQNLKGALK